ncbi:Serine/threonine-protein phosphatase 6 catalytic subunit-like [Homarus americanus]|uniref:Serine/threonine-protein phosphatase n=1 Tax=Homarus americanus TaxID=6706 RepID=A0A8J5K5N9_HOMAM|nr:Serine/threonine-protein phosphatase 6 catalytic subunit-like [Homarus americanus]
MFLQKLCETVCELLLEEGNIQPVSCPVTVCGDIHGQFYDLEELFRTGGQVPDTNYIFMGDFVDRGYYSLETLTRLLSLKAKWPHKITLLRGNHESRQITQVYGFYDECQNKYGNVNAWKYCCKVFDLLTIAAIIDDEVLCVHGDSWSMSPRGAGWLFGARVTHQFTETNNLKLICRAHQLVNEGIKYMFDGKLVTVWSAPNYCYRAGNVASILSFTSTNEKHAKLFDAVPEDKRGKPLHLNVQVTRVFLDNSRDSLLSRYLSKA